jgi:hypothetical protein
VASKKSLKAKSKIEKSKKEDELFYRMLAAFVIALILEITVVTLYRRYCAGANYRPVLRTIMWTFLWLTAIDGAAFIASLVTKRFKYLRSLFALGLFLFGCAVFLRLVNLYGLLTLKIGCIACPVILLLYISYLIYQPEFFMTFLLSALGVFTIWITRRVYYINYYKHLYVMFGVSLFILATAIVTFFAMKNKGVLGKGEWRLRVFPPRTSYLSLFITYGLTLLLFGIYLIFGPPIFYPVMVVFAGFLFVSAIYYTVKLM